MNQQSFNAKLGVTDELGISHATPINLFFIKINANQVSWNVKTTIFIPIIIGGSEFGPD